MLRRNQQTMSAQRGRSRQPDEGQREKLAPHGNVLAKRYWPARNDGQADSGPVLSEIDERARAGIHIRSGVSEARVVGPYPRRFTGQPPCRSTHRIAFMYHQSAGAMSAAPAENRRSRKP